MIFWYFQLLRHELICLLQIHFKAYSILNYLLCEAFSPFKLMYLMEKK